MDKDFSITVGGAAGSLGLPTDLAGFAAARLAGCGAETAACLVDEGMQAFAVRLWLARTASRTLDLQYYSWEDDVAGRLLAHEVLKAADRGVRVRMLLDDTSVIGRDKSFQTIDQHPNIEVRVFNATTWRAHGLLGFGIEFALGGWHLNHRMHNKSWIADEAVAVIGGRNIADHYFDGSGMINFRDLDAVLVGGPVGEATGVFDRYWTSSVVQGVRAFMKYRRRRLRRRIDEFRAALGESCGGEQACAYLAALERHCGPAETLGSRLDFGAVDSARVLADGPEKARDRRAAMVVADEITAVMARAEREVLIVSPYFVPGYDGTALIETLRDRGVRVRVVTNSLAANDVTAVHSGYARYRRRLLRSGVEIHELRKTSGERSRIFGSGGASLHTKAVVVDGAVSFVGSFNLDQRSAKLNTEMGILVDDDEFAACVERQFERLVDRRRSYCVRLDGDGRRLAWCGSDDAVLTAEPDATFRQKLISFLVGLLPMEAQL